MKLNLASASLGLLLLYGSVLCGNVVAQEGHPYAGTWRGMVGNGDAAKPVVIIMEYDGDSINGMINPGRNSYRFENATHDAPSWKIDVAAATREGEAISFTAVMQEIGSVNRFMEGTWTQGGQEHAFKITRE